MDYSNNPDSNQHPNQHDYAQLESIYEHVDSITTVSQTSAQIARQLAANAAENPGQWGKSIRDNGKVAVFEKDFGGGHKMLTHVIWAE